MLQSLFNPIIDRNLVIKAAQEMQTFEKSKEILRSDLLLTRINRVFKKFRTDANGGHLNITQF
jgi:hypothetical protein